jgi:hypothetical protein
MRMTFSEDDEDAFYQRRNALFGAADGPDLDLPDAELPPVAPVRLPPESERLAAVRAAPVMRQLQTLAEYCRRREAHHRCRRSIPVLLGTINQSEKDTRVVATTLTYFSLTKTAGCSAERGSWGPGGGGGAPPGPVVRFAGD